MPGSAGAGGGADPQPALLVLAGVGEALRLLDVLDRDQADQPVGRRRPRAASRSGARAAAPWPRSRPTPSRTVISRSAVISSRTGRSLRGTKRTSRWVRMPTSRPLGPSTTGRPEMSCRCMRSSAWRSGVSGRTRQRVDHHAGLELLDLLDLARLLLDAEILVQDADPAMLRHGDRHRRLGHRVHGGRDQRDAELDLAGQPRAHIDLRPAAPRNSRAPAAHRRRSAPRPSPGAGRSVIAHLGGSVLLAPL